MLQCQSRHKNQKGMKMTVLGKSKLTHKDRADRRKSMADMVRSGVAPQEVAKKTKVTLATVFLACKENGLKIEKKSNVGNEKFSAYDVISALVNTRKKPLAIAEEFGISRQRISQIMIKARKAGIQMPMRKNGTD